MDKKLLDILVCPLCNGPLVWQESDQELICEQDQLGFPVKDGIPVMLPEEARSLVTEMPHSRTTD